MGSKEIGVFRELLQENLSRGAYCGGILSIFENRIEIQKIRDIAKAEINLSTRALYHLGHVRAPTTKVSKFSGCHPFQYGRAIAAHNGIITNTQSKEDVYEARLAVDSEWIPWLYNNPKESFDSAHSKMQSVLTRLDGTYGTWLYDVETNNILVGRADNMIYWNKDKTTFSSKAAGEVDQLMPNGAIYSTVVDKDITVFFDMNQDNRIQRKPKYFIPD